MVETQSRFLLMLSIPPLTSAVTAIMKGIVNLSSPSCSLACPYDQICSNPLSTPRSIARTPSFNALPATSSTGSPWPLQYACDMAPGFQIIEDQRSQNRLQVMNAFAMAFPGCEFRTSTFGDHRRWWRRLTQAEQSAAINAQRTPAGLWSAVAALGKSRPSLKSHRKK